MASNITVVINPCSISDDRNNIYGLKLCNVFMSILTMLSKTFPCQFVFMKTSSFKHRSSKFYLLMFKQKRNKDKQLKMGIFYLYAVNLDKNDLFTRIKGIGLLIHQV